MRWPVGIAFTCITFIVFGLLAAFYSILQQAGRFGQDLLADFFLNWAFWTVAGLLFTCIVTVPLGIHLVLKYKKSYAAVDNGE